uniref:KIB1-4 beta-propeller domain-containing protein n=1 Tax=Aegilops tauschii TaxID=37682 RepID=M8BGQ7_AEGTA
MGPARDWSGLPEDLLLVAMAAMEVPDPPCLLYACDAYGADHAAALYSPSANATFRVPSSLHGVVGSAHGWLFTTDVAANPYLLNPLTGGRAALPPITTLEGVKIHSIPDDDGGVLYDVDRGMRGFPKVKQAADREGLGVASAVYNERDGLFYTLCEGGVVCTFDLSNPSSPAAVRPIAYGAKRHSSGSAARHSHYLLFTPCNAILVVTRRFARALDTPRGGGVATTDLWIHKVRGRDWTCLGDNALILGRNSPLCLPIKDYPMLRPNCAYLTDDLQHTTRQSGGATSASGTSRPGACRSLTISGLSFLGWIHHHRFGLRHLFTRLGT